MSATKSTLNLMMVIIALALVILRPGALDILGALASGLIVAYMLHLLINRARKP